MRGLVQCAGVGNPTTSRADPAGRQPEALDRIPVKRYLKGRSGRVKKNPPLLGAHFLSEESTAVSTNTLCPSRVLLTLLLVAMALCASSGFALAYEPPQQEPPAREVPPEVKVLPEAKRLSPESEVWIDTVGKRVIVAGKVCFREGPLEMFACLAGTKEHESIVAVYSRAYIIHAALLAVGAEQGTPVQFLPEYRPAEGQEIEVTVHWTDEQGQRRQARGQEWIRDMRTKRELAHPWVFGGSGIWKDENSGATHYMAEDGDFICVSNFPSAMLDLPIESSQANDALVYEAYTDRIPPLETEVTLILTPKPSKKPAEK